MKQGRPSISGPHDRKVEPKPKFINPGAVSYLGEKVGNHSTDTGDFTFKATPWSDGRATWHPGLAKNATRPAHKESTDAS